MQTPDQQSPGQKGPEPKTPEQTAPGHTFPPDAVEGQSFKPVEGGDTTSGEALLIEAYAAMWLVALFLILLSWSRQKGIEQRIVGLRASIEKVRGEMDRAAQPEKSESGEES